MEQSANFTPISSDAKKTRLSNMELLRIISMIMVLIVHLDGASLGLPELKGNLSNLDSRAAWRLIVEAFAIVGVNCFTLISGYFGIRLRWKSIGIFLFECVFYSVGIYSLLCLTGLKEFDFLKWLESWMVLTHTDLWYIPAYFCLMLLSPFINAGFRIMTRSRAALLTIALAVFNIWGGWLWKGSFNPTGYTFMQLILMYCIGRCIALYNRREKKLLVGRCLLAGAYVILSLITALYSCWNPVKAFAYNSPGVLLASIALFLLFRNLQFHSRGINYFAQSAFAVYLLHKSPLLWGDYEKPAIVNLWKSTTLVEFSISAIGIVIGVYLATIVIDAVRRKISNKIFR